MEIQHKKNSAKYLAVPMINESTPGEFITGESVTDTAYYKDGAGAWTSLSITDTFAEIGSTGVYEIDLTAAEMNHDQVLIKLTSTSAADSMVLFQMYTNDVDDLATSAALTTAQNDLDIITGADGVNLLSATQASIDAVEADTNELQGDWANGGRLDLILDSRMAEASIDTTAGAIDNVTLVATTTTNTDMRGTDSAATAAALATVDANVDAILVDTGTTIPAQISALNNISVSDILTTQMTQSYAADGTAPTLAQALFLIQQSIGDFAISGTTITVRQLDGSTTAATYTLDDGTSPTARTRAT